MSTSPRTNFVSLEHVAITAYRHMKAIHDEPHTQILAYCICGSNPKFVYVVTRFNEQMGRKIDDQWHGTSQPGRAKNDDKDKLMKKDQGQSSPLLEQLWIYLFAL